MRRILVTGGAGFIGSHIVDKLLEIGHQVFVIDDLSSGKKENLPTNNQNLFFIEDSILNIKNYAKFFGKIDCFYHLAALISSYDSLQQPDYYLKCNINGLLRVLEYIRDYNPGTRIIFSSSSTVYGQQFSNKISEKAMPNPLTIYALSKLSGEHILAIYSELYNFDYLCLRLFNVYGPRQSIDHPYANVTCKFSHAAAMGKSIKLYGDGDQTRDLIFIDDVVRAFLKADMYTSDKIINVGTGEETSINTLISTLENFTGKPFNIEQLPAWSNDIRRIRADISRLNNILDVVPLASLGEGLARTVEWFRQYHMLKNQ